jgi:hypothetical protein
MYPKGCRTTYSQASLRVFANGKIIDSIPEYDMYNYGFVRSTLLPAGNYAVYVKATW